VALENILILHRVLRPRRICDICDLFVSFINLLTYLLTGATKHHTVYVLLCPWKTIHSVGLWLAIPLQTNVYLEVI